MPQFTKYALENSLKKLLLQKPLNKITINDITEDCGINRMTFYYHFRDIYDLVEWVCMEDAKKALADNFVRIFDAVRENKPFIMNVYRCVSREQVEKYLTPLTDDLLMGVINELSAEMVVRAEDKAFIAQVYSYAFVGLMLEWIAADMQGKPEEIVLSQGSAEAIRASVEAHNGPGASLVTAELTYSDGQMAAVRNNIPVIKVKMGPNWSMDIPAMKAAAAEAAKKGTAIVYFVNPNNPTSTIADTNALFDWIRGKPVNTVFILDEAYAEFVEDKSYRSAAELVLEGLDNVIVLKTFSKIFAMAGLRLGFAYAAPERVKKVHDHIAYDFFQNTPAIEAALAEMNDKAFLKQSLEETLESRRIMEEVLKELQLEYLPSQTNFVFFNLKKPLKVFADAMKAEHIMVGRPFPPATTWCRVSYVRPAEMKYVADVMRALRTKGVI